MEVKEDIVGPRIFGGRGEVEGDKGRGPSRVASERRYMHGEINRRAEKATMKAKRC